MTRVLDAVLLAGTLVVGSAGAHDGHDHPPDTRVWKDADGLFELDASFVAAKDGTVTLRKHDGKYVALPMAKFSAADQKWVAEKLAAIKALQGGAGKTVAGADRVALAKQHFAAFPKLVKTRADNQYLYVESRGFPDHPMMVGITAWQQQVPLPQPYVGANAWRIPLYPKLAAKPISAKTALFRGAIALAVNGVPIFNALNNRGEDAYLAGELDEFGGHCGRGDDYHYHLAPVHLEKIAGRGNPIAYALDGFALYGYADAAGNEPKDLDAFNGRMEADGYRYYSTREYPYLNGGMRGEVTLRGDGIEPQPRDQPVRPPGQPLRGAKITGFERDDEKKQYALTYEVRGETRGVKYLIGAGGNYAFAFDDGAGEVRKETYRAGPGGGGQKKGKGMGTPNKDRSPPKQRKGNVQMPDDDGERPPPPDAKKK